MKLSRTSLIETIFYNLEREKGQHLCVHKYVWCAQEKNKVEETTLEVIY